MPGRSSSAGAASKSPPHRAWVKSVIVRQAVLLALDHSSPKPSQDSHPSGIRWVCSPIQWRDRAGITPDFPIKPRRAPVSASLGLCNLRSYSNRSTHGCQMIQNIISKKVDGIKKPDLQ